jgi:magnesium-transporting ATPase (P-type)
LAAAEANPNATLSAIAATFDEPPGWRVQASVPFSSARKWSGATFPGHGSWLLGAPEVLAPTDRAALDAAEEAAAGGSRALLLAKSDSVITEGKLPRDLTAVAVIILSDRVRADAAETIGYFADQGVELKVISGDHPGTVAAIAREVGIAGSENVVDGRTMPKNREAFTEVVERNSVFGRVSPQQKRAMVTVLQDLGHVVAMTGDGVNDVLALKDSDIGIAIGGGAPASRAVAQLVLIDGRFDRLPGIVGEGRRVTSNIERVANLFITSTVYALGLSLAIVISTLPFPFLARHLTLVGSLTIGIPAFFLALAPSRRRSVSGFVSRVLKFSIPTGLVATIATFTGYWLADMEGSTIAEARTTATLILAAIGMFALAIVSRPLVPWKKALIATMSGMLVLAMSTPLTRDFFALDLPRAVVLLAAVGIVAITGGVMVFALRALGWAKVVPAILRQHSPGEPGSLRRLKKRVVEGSGWYRSFPTTTEMQQVVVPKRVDSDENDV